MNIGVLGGTFDPVHMGHLIVAEETRARLNLAEILFVPAGQPRLKMNNLISPAEHRMQMVRLAIADEPYFKLSTMEMSGLVPPIRWIPWLSLRVKSELRISYFSFWVGII